MTTRPEYSERVPAGPFVAWLERETDRLNGDGQVVLAGRLGTTERTLYRWINSLDPTTNEPTDTFARIVVEDALDKADVSFADVYPEIAAAEDAPLEPDAYCGSCHEIVTPINGECPWCARAVTAAIPRQKMYCKREDRMVYPTPEGACWRCGGELKRNAPRSKCACGCGAVISRFDQYGRGTLRYVRGHAPRSLERTVMVPTGPFVEYLREQLERVDPLQAVASKHRLKRDDLVALLRGERQEIDRKDVTHALHAARNYGQPKSAPRAAGKRLYDLYPGLGEKHRCPGCGGRKAPAAELCKSCKRRHRQRGEVTLEELHMSEVVLQRAKRLRFEEWLTWRQVAERLVGQTMHSTAISLQSALVMAFRLKGWPTGRLPVRPLPNDVMEEICRARESRGVGFPVLAAEFAHVRPDLSRDQLEHVFRREFANRGWFTGRLDRGEVAA